MGNEFIEISEGRLHQSTQILEYSQATYLHQKLMGQYNLKIGHYITIDSTQYFTSEGNVSRNRRMNL